MNYCNSEGYASPTEHEALTRIRHEELKEKRQKKYRPIVYICSPFSQGGQKAEHYQRPPFLQICSRSELHSICTVSVLSAIYE